MNYKHNLFCVFTHFYSSSSWMLGCDLNEVLSLSPSFILHSESNKTEKWSLVLIHTFCDLQPMRDDCSQPSLWGRHLSQQLVNEESELLKQKYLQILCLLIRSWKCSKIPRYGYTCLCIWWTVIFMTLSDKFCVFIIIFLVIRKPESRGKLFFFNYLKNINALINFTRHLELSGFCLASQLLSSFILLYFRLN